MKQHIKNLSAGNVLWAAIAYTLFISVLLLMPVSETKSFDLPLDKPVHIIIHIGLIYSWLLFIFKKVDAINLKNAVFLFFGCLLYGIIIEAIQEQFTTTRSADIADVFANSIGAIIGLYLFFKTKYFFIKER